MFPVADVNLVNIVPVGKHVTVTRDESTRRAVLVEPLLDEKGRRVTEAVAAERNILRTKWRLGADPAGDRYWSVI